MHTSYYNTTKETGEQLAQSKAKAINQEDIIINIFLMCSMEHRCLINIAPSDIWNIYCKEYKKIPLTSIRRAISNLTNKQQLVKTDKMKEGIYGKPEHCWRLSKSVFEGKKQLELL